MLTVEDMSHVLGIGLAHAYEIAHRRDFPTITLGSRIIVPRDKFMEYESSNAKGRKPDKSRSKCSGKLECTAHGIVAQSTRR